MYAKLWGGRKLRVGDEISPWNPNIAAIPDLSELISETYVEEIHVTRVEIGDSVEVTIDALPEKIFHGKIYKIANIGQELPGFDAKVFNVLIEITDSDAELKPAMTSNNKIITDHLEDVISIPRECLFSDNGTSYVFIKNSGKVWKKEVVPGLENDEMVVIDSGLNDRDKILMSAPQKMEEIDYLTE
jgi:multidrug efflux pump subunit AcrA (membrane-fusion protein)